jgi:uncharacterized protein YigE (DUF2233 family)
MSPAQRRHRLPPGLVAFVVLTVAAALACSLRPAAPLAPTQASPTATQARVTPTVAHTAIPPTPTPVPATATPLPPDSGWLRAAPGLERRTLRLFNGDGNVLETVTVLRIEPGSHRFEVLYRPDAPRTVQEWAADGGAVITLNAGYFTPEYTALGLVVADGVHYGQSYGDFAGMLAVRPDGVQVRWLQDQPYHPDEQLVAAVQSFPVLIKPGGVLGFPEEDGIPARRTVIGQDRAGRIVIIVCPNGTFTLNRLAHFLLQADLELEIALNLDGGNSTGLFLSVGSERIVIPSYTAVPAVISVQRTEQEGQRSVD